MRTVLCALALLTSEALADLPPAQLEAVLIIAGESRSGTGFACSYRDREFVATNLHVMQGTSLPSIKAQNGNNIKLSGKMIVAVDADIALLSIHGEFEKDYGIKPLECAGELLTTTAIGDEVVCPGNSLGNGVITQTTGEIKAYGQPRLEITSPVVRGNSGGPVLHAKTGKVVGLVTEASNNQMSLDELGKKAQQTAGSPVSDVSYFAHRVDTVQKWVGCNTGQFLEAEKTLDQCEKSLYYTGLFFADRDGWEADKELVEIWSEFNKFIEDADARSHVSVKRTDYVNELGVVVRSDVRIRSKTVSQQDYDKAFRKFIRGLEWKIKGNLDSMQKLQGLGYIQIQRRADLAMIAQGLKTALENFQKGIE